MFSHAERTHISATDCLAWQHDINLEGLKNIKSSPGFLALAEASGSRQTLTSPPRMLKETPSLHYCYIQGRSSPYGKVGQPSYLNFWRKTLDTRIFSEHFASKTDSV
jgi:hypothetical protein